MSDFQKKYVSRYSQHSFCGF